MCLAKYVGRLIFTSVLTVATGGFAQTNSLPHISALEASNYLNQQVVVVDKVVQVAFRSNIWLLHLNQKYPKSPLNAVIRKGYTNDFPNLNACLGQRVEITGPITEFRGRLELALTSSNQLKILSPAQDSAPPAMSAAGAQTKLPLPAPPTSPAPTAGPLSRVQDPSSGVAAPTLAQAPVPVHGPAAPSLPKSEDNSSRALDSIPALLGAAVALLGVGVFLLWRRQRNPACAPQSTGALTMADSAVTDASSAEDWKQRALVAEDMAGKQGQLLREQLIPELTEFAKQSLVQGLYAQRNSLLETQLQAQQALAELESRISAQTPWPERIRVYEQRIAELEREVETQGAEMRELTRATLALVRRKLDDQRESGRLQNRFN